MDMGFLMEFYLLTSVVLIITNNSLYHNSKVFANFEDFAK